MQESLKMGMGWSARVSQQGWCGFAAEVREHKFTTVVSTAHPCPNEEPSGIEVDLVLAQWTGNDHHQKMECLDRMQGRPWRPRTTGSAEALESFC
jgi:hypothetical protein